MNDDAPKPIQYATPEQQRPPRFHVAPMGWVLLVVVVAMWLLSRWL